MHESKGKHIGKAPSLHLFSHCAQLHSMFESYWLSDSYVQANIPSYTDTEAGSYSSFPGHVGGARKWPENEATAVKLVNL